MKILLALTAGLVVASSSPIFGQSITWDLGGSGGYASSNGNTISVTQNGVKVTASAWGYTKGSSNTAFESGKLGQWSPGLGIVNRDENNSSPYHQVDNDTQNDYILFVFDELVDISSIKVTPSPSGYDVDSSYWLGNISNANQASGKVDLSNVTYSGLSSLGFSNEQIVFGSSTYGSADIAINAPSTGVNAILFGTLNQESFPSYWKNSTDAYKVGAITGMKAVPEPSAALLSLLGALGFVLRRRR